MKKYEKIYKELKKKYTDQEIGEAMLFPDDLTEKEQTKAKEELLAFRFQLLQEQTEEERVYGDLLRFKYQIEDYLKKGIYTAEKSFGKHLEEYTRILKGNFQKI